MRPDARFNARFNFCFQTNGRRFCGLNLRRMNYRKHFSQALLFSGIIFGVGLLNFRRLDFYACALAASCFLFIFIHDAGKDYMRLTQQPATSRHAFHAVVNPPYVFVCVLALFYVVAGEMYWLFWATAGFLAFILFVIDASAWLQERSEKN